MKIATCQTPDIQASAPIALEWIQEFATEAQELGARLLCFPEGFLQGYTTERQEVKARALDLNSAEFLRLLEPLRKIEPVLVIGVLEELAGRFFNSAIVVEQAQVVGVYRKRHLLKSESEVFAAGEGTPVFEIDGMKFGINICHDTNYPEAAQAVADKDAQILLCPANNLLPRPTAEKWKARHTEIRSQRARESGLWLVSSDVTGERGNAVSYGPSEILDPRGEVVARVPLGETGLVFAEIPRLQAPLPRTS